MFRTNGDDDGFPFDHRVLSFPPLSKSKHGTLHIYCCLVCSLLFNISSNSMLGHTQKPYFWCLANWCQWTSPSWASESANMAPYIYCCLVNWCQLVSTSQPVLCVLYSSIFLANQYWVILWNCTYTSCRIHAQREWQTWHHIYTVALSTDADWCQLPNRCYPFFTLQ